MGDKCFSVLSLMDESEEKEYKRHQSVISGLEKEIELAKVIIDQSRKWIGDKNTELHNRFLKSLLSDAK